MPALHGSKPNTYLEIIYKVFHRLKDTPVATKQTTNGGLESALLQEWSHVMADWINYHTVKNFGGEKTLANLANHNNSPSFFRQFSCFAIWGARRNVSCA